MLNSVSIKNEAINQTKLENFGNPLFLEGFESLVQSINHEADLNDIGLDAQKYRLTGVLANLLMIEEACIKHPEILNEEINSPVVIVGLPRTGSTMTHRLLASDPNHTEMLWWEGIYQEMLKDELRCNPKERMEMGKAEVEAVMQASPEALTIHPWDYKGADEEILLLEHTFFSTVPESFMRLPSYSKWVESQDHIHAYAQLKKMLQYLKWQNPVISGDIIRSTRKVHDKYERRGSKFVTFEVASYNQNNLPVSTYYYTCIFEYSKGQRTQREFTESPAFQNPFPPVSSTTEKL